MTKYRHALPQLGGQLFLTDGGLETTLVFHDGIELPCFAAVGMLRHDEGRRHLRAYFERYLGIARDAGTGFVLESASWRASPDWAEPLGLTPAELDELVRRSVADLLDLRQQWDAPGRPVVVSGCIGPRGDGYVVDKAMSMAEAAHYHRHQVETLASAGADMIGAITMTNVAEATGIALAARDAGIPVAVSFTVETDGRIPSGEHLRDAVLGVDAATGGAPAYYMVNCAHPDHFGPALGGDWTRRVRGLRANASRLSHAELEASTELDSGDPAEFGALHAALRARLPWLSVLGGCCGTDHRHIESLAAGCGLLAA